LDFLDLGAADPADILDLGLGSRTSGRLGLGGPLSRVNLLLRGAACLLDLILGFLSDRFGGVTDCRLALGRAPLGDLGGLSLEGSGQLSAQGGDNTLDRRFQLLIWCHEASSDYTAHALKSLTVHVLFVKGPT
jgi:hypothetical protein